MKRGEGRFLAGCFDESPNTSRNREDVPLLGLDHPLGGPP